MAGINAPRAVDHWHGELGRKAYLLTLSTTYGWHSFPGRDGPTESWLCSQCFQPFSDRADLCPDFLVAIPAITSPAHDFAPPEDRLFL